MGGGVGTVELSLLEPPKFTKKRIKKVLKSGYGDSKKSSKINEVSYR
jgi:hypothetical protein